jgi:hypothetical protein
VLFAQEEFLHAWKHTGSERRLQLALEMLFEPRDELPLDVSHDEIAYPICHHLLLSFSQSYSLWSIKHPLLNLRQP